ncbi:hypothetical protein D3C74_384430 [compost metagenome]
MFVASLLLHVTVVGASPTALTAADSCLLPPCIVLVVIGLTVTLVTLGGGGGVNWAALIFTTFLSSSSHTAYSAPFIAVMAGLVAVLVVKTFNPPFLPFSARTHPLPSYFFTRILKIAIALLITPEYSPQTAYNSLFRVASSTVKVRKSVPTLIPVWPPPSILVQLLPSYCLTRT